MHSNRYKDQFIQDTEELKKLRLMLITTIISYPLWGILSKYMVPNGYDPLWQRLACSFVSIVLLILTYQKQNISSYISRYYLVAWLYSYHLLFLYWSNPDSVYYVICNLIQFPYVILGFSSKKEAQIYTYTKLASVALLAVFLSSQNINPWFILLSMYTIGAYVMTVVTKYFNVIGSLKQTKAEFDLALTNMIEGVVLMDRDGDVIFYNNSAAEILGFDSTTPSIPFKETALYKDSKNEVSMAFLKGEHPLERVIKTKKPEKGIVLGLNTDEERKWILLNIQPLSNSEKILISFSNITDIRKEHELKEKAQAQLAMNSKLSSLFKVAGGIAHEINNPLSVITTRLQSIEKKLKTGTVDVENIKTSIEKSLTASFRISQVVGTLLNLSRNADENPLVLTKLSQVIEPVLKISRENFRIHDIELVVDDIPDVQIECRPTQISQVFLNLVNNAFEATLNQEIRWARFSFIVRDKKIQIIVSDSGASIPLDVQQRMMEPFFTTKDIGKGAGLGLSVSKAILEEHKGTLILEEDTLNTSFLITLNIA